jgi:hypothetical protein
MNNKNIWFKLSLKSIQALRIYYFIVFAIGLIGLGFFFFFILPLAGILIFQKSLIASIFIALTGSTVFYHRKLYKACINLDLTIPTTEEDSIREKGVKTYFILRPLFSIIFALLFNIILIIGIKISTEQTFQLTEGFIYTNLFFSFFAGFSSGDIIDKLEEKGANIVNKIIDN